MEEGKEANWTLVGQAQRRCIIIAGIPQRASHRWHHRDHSAPCLATRRRPSPLLQLAIKSDSCPGTIGRLTVLRWDRRHRPLCHVKVQGRHWPSLSQPSSGRLPCPTPSIPSMHLHSRQNRRNHTRAGKSPTTSPVCPPPNPLPDSHHSLPLLLASGNSVLYYSVDSFL